MRCRYWPHCEIHRNIARPANLNEANFIEMRELYAEGFPIRVIAESFEISRYEVTKVLQYKSKQIYKRGATA
jgi:DNA invertase Pin-like site-specific DNA recombinase